MDVSSGIHQALLRWSSINVFVGGVMRDKLSLLPHPTQQQLKHQKTQQCCDPIPSLPILLVKLIQHTHGPPLLLTPLLFHSLGCDLYFIVFRHLHLLNHVSDRFIHFTYARDRHPSAVWQIVTPQAPHRHCGIHRAHPWQLDTASNSLANASLKTPLLTSAALSLSKRASHRQPRITSSNLSVHMLFIWTWKVHGGFLCVAHPT